MLAVEEEALGHVGFYEVGVNAQYPVGGLDEVLEVEDPDEDAVDDGGEDPLDHYRLFGHSTLPHLYYEHYHANQNIHDEQYVRPEYLGFGGGFDMLLIDRKIVIFNKIVNKMAQNNQFSEYGEDPGVD